MAYQFTLEKYRGSSSRYSCPACNRVREFTRYIDLLTGYHLAEHVGRCNRVANCGYHYTPKQFFFDNPSFASTERFSVNYKREQKITAKFDLISEDIFYQTLNGYHRNYFIQYLIAKIGSKKVGSVIGRYCIGTWKDGRTVFWQIDTRKLIRTGKIIAYDTATGKRIKSQKPSWVHAELKKEKWNDFEYTETRKKEFHLKQCFFGEHLLQLEVQKPIGIVESEKTAVVASIFLPELLWVATGGCGNLNVNQLQQVMNGRRVILFPDSSKFEYWSVKARDARRIFNIDIHVFNLLELRLTNEQKQEDYDIADYILDGEENLISWLQGDTKR